MEQSQNKLLDYINSLEVQQVLNLKKIYEDKGNQLIADKGQLIKDYKRIIAYITPEENFENEQDFFTFHCFNEELENNRKLLEFYIKDLKIIRTELKKYINRGYKNDK